MRNKATAALGQMSSLAAKQHGLVSHAQAVSAGLSRTAIARLVRSGVWHLARPRVFRIQPGPESFEQRALAACLWLGAEAVLSHRSAAVLWGLNLSERGIELTTLRRGVRVPPGIIVHRSGAVPPEDCRLRRGIPVTSVARTLIDLAGCLDEETLAFVVDEAWRRQLAAPDWLERRLKALGRRGRPGAHRLSRVLTECRLREDPLESALEVRLWRLLRKSKLPLPVTGCRFQDGYGHPGRIDFAYPNHSLAIEADSFEHHGTREAFESDRLRTARLVALGWRVMPVTWRQLEQQQGKVVQRLREALEVRAVALPGFG